METNCCIRCGQPLNLIEESWAEDKSFVSPRGEYCLYCYQDLIDSSFTSH